MNDKQQLAADAAKFAAQFKSFLTAAEMMGAIGSIEQAAGEAQQRMESLREQEAALSDKLTSDQQIADDYVARRHAEADALLARAKEDAEALAGKAATAGDGIIANAKSNAQTIVESAKREARAVEAAISSSRDTLGGIGNDINDERLRLDAVKQEIAAALEKRDDILAQLAALKAKF